MKSFFVLCMLLVCIEAQPRYTNALVHEPSPYLRQHAHNPVNWYPWGEAAFEKARKEHKFIFLSIGYSTCHWCHEMEKESFTDETVAALLNKDFVSIKVDRESYPQIDKKYQTLYRAYYGKRGGWPLSVFMTPEGKVFYLGTYIPKEAGYGSKGLLAMLPKFAAMKRHPRILKKLTDVYERAAKAGGQKKEMKKGSAKSVLMHALKEISLQFDKIYGGFASRPKFPEASKIGLLIAIYHLQGEKKALDMAEETLKKMALGGIYDQIGGGFFRYTTDAGWEYPHYEKMLYTNAELIPVYVEMYEETGDPLCKRVATETISAMQRHFLEDGLYFSASDADSDGEEGGYFIYDYRNVAEALHKEGVNPKEAKEALAYLGITEDGNVDGELSLSHITGEEEPRALGRVKSYLRSARKKRAFPFVDRKIITAWNAMMIKALFVASRIDPASLEEGKKSLSALWKVMRKGDVLYHQVLYGKIPVQKALLEDYAFLCDALIEGYERTYNPEYLKKAEILGKEAVQKFYRNGIWYLSDDQIGAIADFDDRYYTSALSIMLGSLLKLAALGENMAYMENVKQTIETEGSVLQAHPGSTPALTRVYLEWKYGDIIIHAKRSLLQKSHKKIEGIRYPFVLSKVEHSDEYLACRINLCFAHDRNMTAVVKKIDKAAQQYVEDE